MFLYSWPEYGLFYLDKRSFSLPYAQNLAFAIRQTIDYSVETRLRESRIWPILHETYSMCRTSLFGHRCCTRKRTFLSTLTFQSLTMSTSRGSVKSAGEFLLDEDGWKSEAEAIIRDVGEFVKVIHVSDALEVRKRTSEETMQFILPRFSELRLHLVIILLFWHYCSPRPAEYI